MSVPLQNKSPEQTPQSNPEEHAPSRDPSSVQIARIAGIPIRLHFTFLILIAYVAFRFTGSPDAWARISLILGIFGCVALHELGHATVAARYGIKTDSITLYPIGGIARINDRPKPNQELWIALAGPGVNFVIATILAAVLLGRGAPPATVTHLDATQWIMSLLQINLWLALFNLIPAFPMDGGRVLRAALALGGMPAVRATSLASSIGQGLAILFGAYAIFNPGGPNWIWLFIAFFVYIGAGQEAQMVTQENVLTGVPVSKVMVTNLETLAPGASLQEVAEQLLHTSQQDFPVLMGDEVVGLMTRSLLLRGLSQAGPDAYVAGTMNRDFNIAAPGNHLSDILSDHNRAGRTVLQTLPLLVMEQGKLLGMVTSENVAEFFAIQQILASKAQAKA